MEEIHTAVFSYLFFRLTNAEFLKIGDFFKIDFISERSFSESFM